ncbi:MAG: hypothetical protein JXR07_08330 [Reichenbachiella sp.]
MSEYKNIAEDEIDLIELAKRAKAYVIYPNIFSKQTRNFLLFKNYLKIKPSFEIAIPVRSERSKMSAQEVIAITPAILSMTLIIDRLAN